MPSPFPGMNPFLEQNDAWPDFHERFLPAAAEAIGVQVQPDYIVKIDEHVYVHEFPPEPRRLLGRADLGITPTRPQGALAPTVGLLDPRPASGCRWWTSRARPLSRSGD